MSTTFRLKLGVLTTSDAVLYTTPPKRQSKVTSIVLVNVNGSTRTCNLTVNHAGLGARHLTAKDLSLATTVKSSITDAVLLPEGAVITGSASNADSVEYIISVEEYAT